MDAQQEFAEGVRLYQDGQFEAALEHFQQSALLGPSNIGVIYDLALTYANLSQNDNAVQQLQTLLGMTQQQQERLAALELYYQLKEGTYARQLSLSEQLAGL